MMRILLFETIRCHYRLQLPWGTYFGVGQQITRRRVILRVLRPIDDMCALQAVEDVYERDVSVRNDGRAVESIRG